MKKCKCVETLNQQVKEQIDPDGYIETKMSVSLKTGETRAEFPPLTYRYRAKNKDGSFSRQWKTGVMFHNFCPACGEKKR